MASVLMARVWIVFMLAQLNNAESHRRARGRSTDEFHGGSVRQFRSVTDDRKARRPPTLGQKLLTDFFTNKGGALKQWKTSRTFMDISKLPDRDSGHELAYVDATGRLCLKFGACYPTLSKNVLGQRMRRAPQDTDFLDLWSFDEIPDEPFDPDTTTSPPQTTTAPPQTTTSPPQTTPQTTDAPVTEENDSDFNDFWGLEEIPEDPYTGVDVEIPALTTTTLTPPATTTSAPLTTTNDATPTPEGPTTGTPV